MARFEYGMQCPLCKYICKGNTPDEVDTDSKAHAYRKHPMEYSIAQKYTEEKEEK